MNRTCGKWWKASGRNVSGFTLIELLLAITMSVMILAFLMQSFSITVGVWRDAEARTDTFREARAALDLMARDLRTVVPAINPPFITGTTTNGNPPMLVLDYDPATPPADQANDEVYAISSLPNQGKSDLCMVGYRCVWDANAKCYILRRLFKDSDTMFGDFTKSQKKVSPGFLDYYSRTNAIDDDAASYVWDLRFRPCDNTGASAGIYPRRSYSTDFPACIEISFKAVGASAVERLKTMPVTQATWLDQNPDLTPRATDPTYQRNIQPYLQQFVLRVKLEAANPPPQPTP